MAKNIVICCDGTGNEIEENLSNVLKLYRIAKKDDEQLVFYDSGIGTIGPYSPFRRLSAKVKAFGGMALGMGLDQNIKDAYRFLIKNYEEGDRVYLFGFSRGAFTVRALAGFIRLLGLLRPEQINLIDHAYTAFKKAAEKKDFKIAWRYHRVLKTRHLPIKFLGIWDTVNSVMVPRPDRFYLPSFEELPYTTENDSVEICRHAVAIDEKRRFFRLSAWTPDQTYRSNPFDKKSKTPQDFKEVWFAGVHSDVGGGYPETASGLAKFPLQWMVEEAASAGLQISTKMEGRLIRGTAHGNSTIKYVTPSIEGKLHRSLTYLWWLAEIVPKFISRRETRPNWPFFLFYFPFGERRKIPENALVHWSALERENLKGDYLSKNFPKNYHLEGMSPSK